MRRRSATNPWLEQIGCYRLDIDTRLAVSARSWKVTGRTNHKATLTLYAHHHAGGVVRAVAARALVKRRLGEPLLEFMARGLDVLDRRISEGMPRRRPGTKRPALRDAKPASAYVN